MAKRERRLMATCKTPDLHPLSGQLIRDVTPQPAYYLGLPFSDNAIFIFGIFYDKVTIRSINCNQQ